METKGEHARETYQISTSVRPGASLWRQAGKGRFSIHGLGTGTRCTTPLPIPKSTTEATLAWPRYAWSVARTSGGSKASH